MDKYYNADVVQWLVADWHVQLLRIPMAINDTTYGGYLQYPDRERTKVERVVDAAIQLGIYVIIDWHDHFAENHAEQAIDFFRAMSEKYGQNPNVLFEPYNEPEGTGQGHDAEVEHWNAVIKPYHESIIPVIRQHSNNVIILGNPCWSQCVDIASLNPAKGTNLAYTLHFYAGAESHMHIRNRAQTALNRGLALLATEWGTCHYDGSSLNFVEAGNWLDFMAVNGISDANWAISDKEGETCSVLKPASCEEGRWPAESLTQAGSWIRESIRAHSQLWSTIAMPGPTTCAAAIGQCGGRSWCGPTCCIPDHQCVVHNEWYSDCQPAEGNGRRLRGHRMRIV